MSFTEKYKEDRKFFLFCKNKVDWITFKEAFDPFAMDYYIKEKFYEFNRNPSNFFFVLGAEECYINLHKKMVEVDYRG